MLFVTSSMPMKVPLRSVLAQAKGSRQRLLALLAPPPRLLNAQPVRWYRGVRLLITQHKTLGRSWILLLEAPRIGIRQAQRRGSGVRRTGATSRYALPLLERKPILKKADKIIDNCPHLRRIHLNDIID